MTSIDRLPAAGTIASRLAAALIVALAAALWVTPARARCEFAPVRQAIDDILDRDADKAAKFRREVSAGADSIAVLEALVSPDMQKMIDICRFETAEYLTKRGFPPFH